MKNEKRILFGIEVNGWHLEMHNFLTENNRDREMLFQIMLEEYGIIGKTIIKFQNHIRENRNIDFDEVIKACRNKEIVECKDILEELFLEPIDINFVASRMKNQGWSIENLILEHKNRPDKRIHRILNTYYSK